MATSTYLEPNFTQYIPREWVKTVVELGSRDLLDAVKLYDYYKCPIYAFECNEDCLKICRGTQAGMTDNQRQNIHLVDSAVCVKNGPVTFYPFDLNKYDNMGSSSMLKIDFSKRSPNDGDYNRENPQKEIIVQGVRMDTFMTNNNINNIDLLCMDLQGYELNALLSFGQQLENVNYIITECQINQTYTNGVEWRDLYSYLKSRGFEYVISDAFGNTLPFENNRGAFIEFNALFKNTNM